MAYRNDSAEYQPTDPHAAYNDDASSSTATTVDSNRFGRHSNGNNTNPFPHPALPAIGSTRVGARDDSPPPIVSTTGGKAGGSDFVKKLYRCVYSF